MPTRPSSQPLITLPGADHEAERRRAARRSVSNFSPLKSGRAAVVEPAGVAHQHGAADAIASRPVPGSSVLHHELARRGRRSAAWRGAFRTPARAALPARAAASAAAASIAGMNRLQVGSPVVDRRWVCSAAARDAFAARIGAALPARRARGGSPCRPLVMSIGAHVVAHRLQTPRPRPRAPCPARSRSGRCGCRSWAGRSPPARRASSRACATSALAT